MQTNGNGDLSAAADEAEQELSTRRVWLAECQQGTPADDNKPSRPAVGRDGAEGGEHDPANGVPLSDAATEELVSTANEGSTGARARWGKAVKTVVATDKVQVDAQGPAVHPHADRCCSYRLSPQLRA